MPPEPGRIRLSDFVAIFGQKRDAFRAMVAIGHDPFPTPKIEEKQRTWTGADALAYELFLAMIEDGTEHAVAGHAVKGSMAVQEFNRRLKAGESVNSLCLGYMVEANNDPIFGFTLVPGPFHADADEISGYLTAAIDKIGKTFRRTARPADSTRLGPRHLSVVPVWPAYMKAKARCAAAGFVLDGDKILRTTPETPEGAE